MVLSNIHNNKTRDKLCHGRVQQVLVNLGSDQREDVYRVELVSSEESPQQEQEEQETVLVHCDDLLYAEDCPVVVSLPVSVPISPSSSTNANDNNDDDASMIGSYQIQSDTQFETRPAVVIGVHRHALEMATELGIPVAWYSIQCFSSDEDGTTKTTTSPQQKPQKVVVHHGIQPQQLSYHPPVAC